MSRASAVVGPADAATLQRRVGNRAVAQVLGTGTPRPVVSRSIGANARAGALVVENATGTSYRLDNVFGGDATSEEHSRQQMALLTPVAGGQSRIVHTDDDRYDVGHGQAPAAVAPAPAQGAVPATRPFPPDPDSDFSFEGWFNYFWDEVSDATKIHYHRWAAEYQAGQHTGDDDKADALEAMFLEGFIAYDVPVQTVDALQKDPGLFERASAALGLGGASAPKASVKGVPPGQLAPGPDPGDAPQYKVDLPILAGTGLGYRADSRDWAKVVEQGGSKAQARVSAPAIRQGRNFDKAWNPFREPQRQTQMYLRRGHQDNCTRTIVSVAHDIRDTVTFPKPKPDLPGVDTVTVYVVYVQGAMDTSALGLDLWNAARWARGEVAAYEIPAEHHLARLTVERFYDSALGSFVVGRIKKAEQLNADRAKSLPPTAAQAFQALWRKLASEELRWLRFGGDLSASERKQQRASNVEKLVTLGERAGLELSKAKGPERARLEREIAGGYRDLYREIYRHWNDQAEQCFTMEAFASDKAAAVRNAVAAAPVVVAGPPGPPPPGGRPPNPRQVAKRALIDTASKVLRSFQETGVPAIRRLVMADKYKVVEALKGQQSVDPQAALGALDELATTLDRVRVDVDQHLVAWETRRPAVEKAGTTKAWQAFVTDVLRVTGPA